jgi:hypothetical protein
MLVLCASVLWSGCSSATGEAVNASSDDTDAAATVANSDLTAKPGEAGPGADASSADPKEAGSSSQEASSSDAQDGAPPPPAASDGGAPAGWLFTKGNGIYLSNGGSSTRWMGRGFNLDDIFMCGYDNNLWLSTAAANVQAVAASGIGGWKPNFVRMSLSMNSYGTAVSWLSDPAQYKTPMTAIINGIGQNPGLYVLVTLRSDTSMTGQDTGSGDGEATGLPTGATDATYVALVDSFANSNFVLFGLSNEPGGGQLSDSEIASAMTHAVGVIRAEEDRLGVPHHIVSVQGNAWTSDISFYAATPLPYDNVVYEVHGYPPSTTSYTFSNIPVIIGEYGDLPDASSFYVDVESKQIPNLAWDLDPYSDCAPDLVVVNDSTTLSVTSWGSVVQNYLLSHSTGEATVLPTSRTDYAR